MSSHGCAAAAGSGSCFSRRETGYTMFNTIFPSIFIAASLGMFSAVGQETGSGEQAFL